MATVKDSDGKELSVGDYVGFKSDIEQYGQITHIEPGWHGGCSWVTLVNESGFSGEYIGGQTVTKHPADSCWKD